MLIEKFSSIEKNSNGYLVKTENAYINLVFLTNDIVRVRVSFDHKFKEQSYALVMTAWEDRFDDLLKSERKRIDALDIDYKEEETHILFQTKTMNVKLFKKPLHFQITDNEGTLLYSDLPERAFEQDHLGRLFHYNCINPKTDHVYGFGEKTGHIDKIGRRMRMAAKDAIGHDPEHGDPLYKHIPFYIKLNGDSQKACGLYYHNSYESLFDMGCEISGYWRPYSYFECDGGDIDLFFINGPTIKEVVTRYTDLTGKQAMPPKQSLGFTSSTMYYAELDENCDEEIYKVIESHRDNKMYLDNFWLASGYSSGEEDNLRYVFNWNKRRFPNPQEFFDKMNAKGINVIVNLKPGILENHPFMSEFKDADAFVKTADRKEDYIGRWWGGEGRFVDFTKPAGRDVWKKLLKESVLSKGTITVWNDNCEYDGIEDRMAYCDFEGEGGNIAELKPIQANLMAYLAKEAIAEVHPNKRPYIINRAGYSGIQRYAQTWAGDNLTDWKTVKFNIATIIGMGLSGVANTGCDIGGFAGPAPEGELLLRWIQNGIFQPRFCMNSANNDNTVTQPWMYAEHNENVRAAYKLRYQMLPYLYSLMFKAHKEGTPIMQPLFYEFQDDYNCYNDENFTFLYGSSLLVANVVEKSATSRTIYLPKGSDWFDMSDNFKQYSGGQTIEIPVGLDSIPMFLRDTGIFVSSNDITQITRDTLKNLDVLIGSGTDMSFDYYDDDGESNDFEKEVYDNLNIHVSGNARKEVEFTKTGKRDSTIENFSINVISPDKGAYWVSLEDNKLKQFLVVEDFNSADEGWYYNLSNKKIQIKFKSPKKENFKLVVSTEKFDLIGMVEE